MGLIKKTKFKVYNGTDYDTEYFETSADQVKMDDGSTVQDILLKVYPVGSIYLSVTNTNPGTLFGGTWQSWGAGRVPVGISPSDSEFNTAEKTGGAKTVDLAHSHTVNGHTHTTAGHALTTSEMPSHTHEEQVSIRSADGSEFGISPMAGSNGTSGAYKNLDMSSNTVINGGSSALHTKSAGSGASHSHGNTGSASPGTSSQLSNSQSVMQPYITCYMWKRTA